MALCGAIFRTLENDEKMPNKKGINTYGTFWGSIFKKLRKTEVALCGAMWRYFLDTGKRLKTAKYERNQYIWHFLAINFQENPENDSKNAKYERKQYIWHVLEINFQENPENDSGAMWRYVALFFEHWKTIKNCQI